MTLSNMGLPITLFVFSGTLGQRQLCSKVNGEQEENKIRFSHVGINTQKCLAIEREKNASNIADAFRRELTDPSQRILI